MTTPVKAIVTSTSFCNSEQLVGELSSLPIKVSLYGENENRSEEALTQAIIKSEAEVAIVGTEPVTRRMLSQNPQLKMISKYGVGLDNLDRAAMNELDIQLGWTGGVNKRSVSEQVIAFAIGHLRNVTPAVVEMRQGHWHKNGGRQLSDVTFGIVGLGHVGGDVAKLLSAFGTKVLFNDIEDRSAVAVPLGAEYAEYDELIKQSDVISFHVPLTDQTRLMFGEREIKRAKDSALVINTSRGMVVDFDATVEAVTSCILGGFCADVYPDEPCDLSRFGSQPHLYFTPHIGGNAKEAVLAMGRSAIGHVKNYCLSRSPM